MDRITSPAPPIVERYEACRHEDTFGLPPALARQIYELRRQLFEESGVPNGRDLLYFYHSLYGDPKGDGGESNVRKCIELGDIVYVVGNGIAGEVSQIDGILHTQFVDPAKAITKKQSSEVLSGAGVVRHLSELFVREPLRGLGLAKILIAYSERDTKLVLANEKSRLKNPDLKAIHTFNFHPQMEGARETASRLAPGSIEIHGFQGQDEKMQPLFDQLVHFAQIL